MRRVEITRVEFTELWGMAPHPDAASCRIYGGFTGNPVWEYVFIDEPVPAGDEVEFLERLFQL